MSTAKTPAVGWWLSLIFNGRLLGIVLSNAHTAYSLLAGGLPAGWRAACWLAGCETSVYSAVSNFVFFSFGV
eukprot:COSAG05_NODE_929_length_6558_cov_3.005264_4_plen_72_part_00